MMQEHRSHHDCANELNLSKEQREKFNSIRDKTRHQTHSLKNRISDLSAMLDKLYAEERPDVEKISNVHNDIHALERKIIEIRIKSRNQKYDLLNTEQRVQFKRAHKVNDCGYHHRGHINMPHMMK
ncbi:MAG: Spy/CpxP family protein refolding chaperone [Sulfuriflexus sp.]|nr:Spy/CpxP family protein refolding chaperone [Sulfuriflexus sp.]